jgi:hypothetical protein
MRTKIKISQSKFWSKVMDNGWTAQRKAKQAMAIQNWKPWKQSIGPKTLEGKATVARNAYKGGKRSALRQSIAALKLYFRANNDFLDELLE